MPADEFKDGWWIGQQGGRNEYNPANPYDPQDVDVIIVAGSLLLRSWAQLDKYKLAAHTISHTLDIFAISTDIDYGDSRIIRTAWVFRFPDKQSAMLFKLTHVV